MSFQVSNEKKRKAPYKNIPSLVLPAHAAISVFPAAFLDSHYYVYIHTLEPFAQSLGGHREQHFFSTP